MHNVLDPLARKGADTVVIPVAATASLKPAEAAEFRALLNRDFDAMVAVGGDDIHPSLYGDPDPRHLAVKTNLARDREELAIVRSYLKDGQGFFSGICRGHQMGGVAGGCRLIKDIDAELGLSHPNGQDHKIVRGPRAGALTKRLFGPDKEITVMSLHHQSVVDPGSGNKLVRVTGFAKGKRKIAEISEYAGGRGLSVQTHPELMSGGFHRRYYDLLFSRAQAAAKERFAAAAGKRSHGFARAGGGCAARFKALE
jgi:gamma-glutamyl-gamma-aminobutyrate hydrolase PuuD